MTIWQHLVLRISRLSYNGQSNCSSSGQCDARARRPTAPNLARIVDEGEPGYLVVHHCLNNSASAHAAREPERTGARAAASRSASAGAASVGAHGTSHIDGSDASEEGGGTEEAADDVMKLPYFVMQEAAASALEACLLAGRSGAAVEDELAKLREGSGSGSSDADGSEDASEVSAVQEAEEALIVCLNLGILEVVPGGGLGKKIKKKKRKLAVGQFQAGNAQR
jgi:hypothetical protein